MNGGGKHTMHRLADSPWRLVGVAVTIGALALAARLQQDLKNSNESLTRIDKSLTVTKQELDLERKRNASLESELRALQNQIGALRSETIKHPAVVTTAPKTVSSVNCASFQGSLDQSGRLRLSFPNAKEGQQYTIVITGETKSGGLTATYNLLSQVGDAKDTKLDQGTDFISISKVTLTGPDVDLSCAATSARRPR